MMTKNYCYLKDLHFYHHYNTFLKKNIIISLILKKNLELNNCIIIIIIIIIIIYLFIYYLFIYYYYYLFIYYLFIYLFIIIIIIIYSLL